MSSSSVVEPKMEKVSGINGLEKVILRNDRGYSVEVYRNGGQVTSWKNELGEELLFLSSKAKFENYEPIRGGIHTCFPQFSDFGPLDLVNGFARKRLWTFESPKPDNSYVDLLLDPLYVDKFVWDHSFKIFLRVVLESNGDQVMTSRVKNTDKDGKAFTFTFGYHTHFNVSDIGDVRIEGLETLDFLDNLQNRKLCTDQGDAITFESEVDKVFLNAHSKIAIIDHGKSRTFVLTKEGLPDVGVWNPWDKKAKALTDFGNHEYKGMVCVDAAETGNQITLKPGEEWTGTQKIHVVPSSYNSGPE